MLAIVFYMLTTYIGDKWFPVKVLAQGSPRISLPSPNTVHLTQLLGYPVAIEAWEIYNDGTDCCEAAEWRLVSLDGSALDEYKTHLRGPKIILRSKTPDLVRQEFYGLMTAH